jgi:hypothetical protein
VDEGLVDLGVGKDTVDGLDSGSEEILAKLLESGSGDGSVKVDTLEQRVDLDRGLSRRGKGSLGSLTSSAKTSQGTDVRREILLVLSLEFVNEVVDQTVVEVLTTQVGVTGSRLDLEDTLLNGEERNIEGTTTEIEDEDVALTLNLLVETVGNGGSGRLVDDSENVETGDETGILGSLTLGVVEVGGDGDDSVIDCATKVSLGGLTHLDEDHRRDLLWGEDLLLALELNLDDGLAATRDDLEGEMLHVGLDLRILELAANEALRVEDSVGRVHRDLVLGGITDQTLRVREGHEGRRCPVALVIADDFAPIVPKDTNTAVGST